MDEINRLQKNLSTLRTCAGWSVQEFADMLGVTRQTINNLENSEGTPMSKTQYIAIRTLFSYEIEETKNKKLYNLLYYLVDNPDKLTPEKREQLSIQANILSAAEKGGAKKKDVNKMWDSALKTVGLIAYASAITFGWLYKMKEK